MIELMIALAISATLLTASLAALDAAFKSYKATTESASTHVVTRMVVHRVLTMIRTGREFGPFPLDVLDPAQNPMVSGSIEFVSAQDEGAGYRQVTRLEAREDETGGAGDLKLMLIIEEDRNGTITTEERPLLRRVRNLTFTLEYDIGPVLKLATMDLTVAPDDSQGLTLHADIDAPTIRMVASSSPRALEGE